MILGVLAIRSAANELTRVVRDRGGPAAGTTVRLLITLIGYVIVVLALLGMLAVPLGHLLVGGAITGIVVGIAAQQSLSNIFAGLLILLARPYVVGEEIRVNSGSTRRAFRRHGHRNGSALHHPAHRRRSDPPSERGLLAAAVGPRRARTQRTARTIPTVSPPTTTTARSTASGIRRATWRRAGLRRSN